MHELHTQLRRSAQRVKHQRNDCNWQGHEFAGYRLSIATAPRSRPSDMPASATTATFAIAKRSHGTPRRHLGQDGSHTVRVHPFGGSYVVKDGRRFYALDINAVLIVRPARLSMNLRPVDFKAKPVQREGAPAQVIVPGSMKRSIATISQDADDWIESAC